ncbi:MAG TPA: FtsX-like permease family protein [Acidimicrobiia bacterium]|nr:FtsX-like permease family protein [Acidimicrobiia bacterium]
MTSVIDESATDRQADGGIPARRAVTRWAWRLFRRQWRGQALLLSLLTLAVAAAAGGVSAAYNLAPTEGNARFGSANHVLEFEDPDPVAVAGDVAAAREWFDTIDVISRQFQLLPGLFEPVEFRVQDPDGPLSSPMLALVAGRYPSTAGEAAVTDGAAETYDVKVGDSVEFGDQELTVVGLVENPSDLYDEFALLAPSHPGSPEAITILTEGSEGQLESFRPPSGASAVAVSRPGNESVVAALGVLTVGTLVLVLVALVAAAGFVVIAQRRLRQLGMLAAIGATTRHLRLVMVANGVVIGAIAALVGTLLALLAWFALVPSLETTVAHRIDAFDLPWWLIATIMLLSVATATAAAWWPAQAVARTPIVSALSGRPGRPQPARRSATVAGPSFIAGVTCLFLAGDPLDGWINVILILAGTAALILGLLTVSPLAIRTLTSIAGRSSVAVRLSARDLVRYQARSSTALSAVGLALGIAATIVIATSTALYTSGAEGNLAATHLMVRIGEIPAGGDVAPIPARSGTELEHLETAVDEIAGALGEAIVIPIDVAIAPEFEGVEGLPAVVLTKQIEPGFHRILTFLYVGSPELLDIYDVELDAIPTQMEVLTVETGDVWFEPMSPELVTRSGQLTSGYTALPDSFITPAALNQRGWDTARASWLIETNTPITEDQFMEAREVAASAGITVEARDDQADLASLRTGATAMGTLVALGILALTVGLIRSEAQADLRTLTASGATSRIRRTLAAATAGALGLLGAILGTVVAYLGFAAANFDNLARLLPVPLVHLIAIVIGVPAIAAASGWLLPGAEPTTLARRQFD